MVYHGVPFTCYIFFLISEVKGLLGVGNSFTLFAHYFLFGAVKNIK